MSTPHKHAEFIKAIADGVSVDMRAVGDDTRSWTTLLYFYPFDNEGIEFRLTPHRWQAEIDAKKARKAVQWKVRTDSNWCTLYSNDIFDEPIYEFRIKPEVLRFRLYKWSGLRTGAVVLSCVSEERAASLELPTSHFFLGWLGDWQEVEA